MNRAPLFTCPKCGRPRLGTPDVPHSPLLWPIVRADGSRSWVVADCVGELVGPDWKPEISA